jgi:hypothetical protein
MVVSFYLDLKESEYLKVHAATHELSINEIVRDQLMPLLKNPVV